MGGKPKPWRKQHKRAGKQVREWVSHMRKAKAAGDEVEDTPLGQIARNQMVEEMWEQREANMDCIPEGREALSYDDLDESPDEYREIFKVVFKISPLKVVTC